jgi:hypothetical protein
MAFNLKKVLKALLLSSSQPLAIKDIQAAFTRFHEQASALPFTPEGTPETNEPAANDAPASLPTEEVAEIPVEAPQDPELYSEVPSLVTAAQIREAMDQMTDLVFLSRPEPHHAAFFPCGAPLIGNKPSFLIQRCREFIAALTASFREVMIAGQLQTNLAQTHATLLKGNVLPAV